MIVKRVPGFYPAPRCHYCGDKIKVEVGPEKHETIKHLTTPEGETFYACDCCYDDATGPTDARPF